MKEVEMIMLDKLRIRTTGYMLPYSDCEQIYGIQIDLAAV